METVDWRADRKVLP